MLNIWRLGLPSKSFIRSARPSQFTPDRCVLEQQEHHYVFDFRKKWPNISCVQFEAYTEPRFQMFLQNHVDGTPPLIFTENIYPKAVPDIDKERMLPHVPRAKLRGRLHIVTPKDIVELDNQMQNGLLFNRRLVRIVLPHRKDQLSDADRDTQIGFIRAYRTKSNRYFQDALSRSYETVRNLSEGTPIKTLAWVYEDHPSHWVPQFKFDWDMWRGRRDAAFQPAKTFKDERTWINEYFVPTQGKAHKPKLTMGFRDNDVYRFDMKAEEHSYYEEHPTKPTPADEMRRPFIYISSKEETTQEEVTVLKGDVASS